MKARALERFFGRVFAMLARLLRSLMRWTAPTYSRFSHGPIILLEHRDNPQITLQIASARFVYTADFLPDRATLSGESFQSGPHVEFARQYLADAEGGNFKFSKTKYYRLAQKGRLPVPVKGTTSATLRVQEFIHLIDSVRADVGCLHGRIVLVECIDGSFAVIDGKHRLAALIALGVEDFEFSLSFDNELRELYRPAAALAWPQALYRKSHDLVRRFGVPIADRVSVERLIFDICAEKLETWTNIYHPLPFREFGGLSTQITSATPYRRLGMILEDARPIRGSNVLDLGCNLGFYSFSLARRGAHVTGVDIREDYHKISIELARLYELPVRFVKAGVSPELIESLGPQDITLCFSTIQWVIAQDGFKRGMQTLEAISRNSSVCYFDVPVNVGAVCLKCPPGQEITYVENLLRRNTLYSSVSRVGCVHPYGSDIRHVFRCERAAPYG